MSGLTVCAASGLCTCTIACSVRHLWAPSASASARCTAANTASRGAAPGGRSPPPHISPPPRPPPLATGCRRHPHARPPSPAAGPPPPLAAAAGALHRPARRGVCQPRQRRRAGVKGRKVAAVARRCHLPAAAEGTPRRGHQCRTDTRAPTRARQSAVVYPRVPPPALSPRSTHHEGPPVPPHTRCATAIPPWGPPHRPPDPPTQAPHARRANVPRVDIRVGAARTARVIAAVAAAARGQRQEAPDARRYGDQREQQATEGGRRGRGRGGTPALT